VADLERVCEQEPSVKMVRDGLNVSFLFNDNQGGIDHFLFRQDIKCAHYQLAGQSLAADTNLHKRFDDTRHEGKNEMDYIVRSLDVPLEANAKNVSVVILLYFSSCQSNFMSGGGHQKGVHGRRL